MANPKSAWLSQSQRSRYLKTGGILTFILFLFYYLAPTSTSGTSLKSALHKGSSQGQVASDPSLGTDRCSRSSDASKPIVQYVVMIDAGSTGSRVHVYRFNNCGTTPELEKEDFKMTEPRKGGAGLSAYPDDPEAAAQSLDVLMDVAMANVPDKLKSCTPVAVKATAGLRLLGEEKSNKILQAVKQRLETKYPFPVVEKDGVVIMGGNDEGVYAWITTNYLLGKIGGPDHSETAAVLDLGGGSTQIVFEPTFKSPSHGMPEKLAEGDHKYVLDFGGRRFELYQHSHLGYGLMSARNSIHKALVDLLYNSNLKDSSWKDKPVVNPCLAVGTERNITVKLGDDHPLGKSVELQMKGPSSNATPQCRALSEKILLKDKECALSPCSFGGIHQPSMAKTFSREDIYAFSYFYDRTNPLGMPEKFTIKELNQLATQVCAGSVAHDVFAGVEGAIAELQDRPEWCLDLNFMVALLHTGYDLPIDRELITAKKIKGNELGWCLGASLPLLSQGSGWQCRVKEVS